MDIRNYTGLARELGESRITELMNKLFHEAGGLLKRHGSWAQKDIGDAVMAFWVHDDQEGTPREIVLIFESLIELMRLVAALSDEFALPRRLEFGAGINSGLAATGNMGSAGLTDHTAMGDAVNKAFRLESVTKELGRGVVIGKSTFALMAVPETTRSLFTTHDVALKGYDEPEEVHGLDLADVPSVVQALSR
jgi:adenylate cyclase